MVAIVLCPSLSCTTFYTYGHGGCPSLHIYDYDRDTVRDGIAQILAHKRTAPIFIDQNRAKEIIDKSTEEYQARVQGLTDVITTVSAHVPRRRERKMRVGLFGYGRSLGGVGGVTLPRAIGFAASLHSIGVPPELPGTCLADRERS